MKLFLLFLLLLLLNPIVFSYARLVRDPPFPPLRPPLQRRNLAAKPKPAEAPAPEASASPPPPTTLDLIGVMSKKGCKTFADLLTAGTGDVANTYLNAMSGGLTVFCPKDEAMKAFMPKYKNLTADGKVSFLLYHGVPVYNSLSTLKTSNGVVNTLATDGTARDYNFTVQDDGAAVTLQTDVTTATIRSTVVDRDPVAVFAIDEVLEPRELFKAPAPAPVPAPAEAPAADAPKASKKGKKKKKHVASPPAPEGPDAAPADQKAADENAGLRSGVSRWAMAAAGVVVGVMIC